MTKRLDFEIGIERGGFLVGGYWIGFCRYDGRRIYDLHIEGAKGGQFAKIPIGPLDTLYAPLCSEIRRQYADELEAKKSPDRYAPEPLRAP